MVLVNFITIFIIRSFCSIIFDVMRLIIVTLVLLILTSCQNSGNKAGIDNNSEFMCGAIVRGDLSEKSISLVFTGDEFADGGMHILSVLKSQHVPGSFFLTGKFYRNRAFEPLIRTLVSEGHYLGAHSDQHLLYCAWENRDSLLVCREEFQLDLENNYRAMKEFGILKENAPLFLPPYEWYNDTISQWTLSMGLQMINFSPGTLSHVDYTLPGTPEYRSSKVIYRSILEEEQNSSNGLNGFILLTHIGTSPERKDKFHETLEDLIRELKSRGYEFKRIDDFLLNHL